MIVPNSSSAQITPSLQPFVLEPVLVDRIWGTDDLAPWHSNPEPPRPIGEIWLTAEQCHAEISGDAPESTLAELTRRQPDLLGDPEGHGFPLLIKLLFPREKLSVQVHPNDAEAQALGMPRGKTECWYVLSAEPGAQVAVGFKAPMTPESLQASIEDGSLEDHLRMLPVRAGDMVYVDAGTIHAIGPGMVVLETQQYSDTTYRLWDYGRPRELHVEAGCAVTRPTTDAGLVAPVPMPGFTRLIASPYFLVDSFKPHDGPAEPLGNASSLQILIALGEGCHLLAANRNEMPLPSAKAVVIPANNVSYALRVNAGAHVIRVLQP